MIDGLLFDFWRCLSGLISCKTVCVTETELDSEATMYYVIGAILYRTLGVILPAPMWVHLVISTLQLLRFQTTFHLLFLPMSFFSLSSFCIFQYFLWQVSISLTFSFIYLLHFFDSLPFYFCALSSFAPLLFLIPTCNSQSVFSLIVSLLLPPHTLFVST